MTDDRDEDGGRGALRAHLSRVSPPRGLERRVRDTLRVRRLVRPTVNRARLWLAQAGLVAAGVAVGVAASTIARVSPSTEAAARAPRYALLLYGDTPGDTGAVHAARAREYGQWASSVTDGARWVGGQELGAALDVFGPAGSTGDRMAGVFIIEADSPARAAEVARTCPHLKYGGRVVLVPVVPPMTTPPSPA